MRNDFGQKPVLSCGLDLCIVVAITHDRNICMMLAFSQYSANLQ